MWQRFKAAITENNSSLRNCYTWHTWKNRKSQQTHIRYHKETNGIWKLKNAITENETQ